MAAIDAAPSSIPMHNRLGELTMPLGGDRVFFGSGSDCLFTIDVETGERRQTTTQDVQHLARLCDGLDQIDFVMGMGSPWDVPSDDHYLHSFINMLRGTAKPLLYTAKDRTDMEHIYRIACAIAGGEAALREKPFLLLYAEPISPLLFNDESVDKLLFCAEQGIPVTYVPSPNTGVGGPVTLAGAIALGNAECLVGLLLTQLVRRGTPFLYGVNTAALDMRSTIVSYGSPEYPKGMAAFSDLMPPLRPAGLGHGGCHGQQGGGRAGRHRSHRFHRHGLSLPLQLESRRRLHRIWHDLVDGNARRVQRNHRRDALYCRRGGGWRANLGPGAYSPGATGRRLLDGRPHAGQFGGRPSGGPL